MSKELDELSERYSDLLATYKSGTHITWVGAREVLRTAVREAYDLGYDIGREAEMVSQEEL